MIRLSFGIWRTKLQIQNSRTLKACLRKVLIVGCSKNEVTFSTFSQDAPKLANQYTSDPALEDGLSRVLPEPVLRKVEDDLTNFGKRVVTDIWEMHKDASKYPPKLEQYDAWGDRVDKVHLSEGWKSLHEVSAEEGLISIAYDNNLGSHGEFNRIYQTAKLLMFAPSSGLYYCPVLMTDGAARLLVHHGLNSDEFGKEIFERLTSKDPKQFWTSGQWMTERRGGSDVAGGTETRAIRQNDGSYKLYGVKYFTSAVDAHIAMALARCTEPELPGEESFSGHLSCFMVKTRTDLGTLTPGIKVRKLKDKLGTRQLPTAELELDGVEARLICEKGRGVATLAPMMNVARFHNGIAAVGYMKRIIALCRDFAFRRESFGKPLSEHELYFTTLSKMEIVYCGCLQMILDTAQMLGRTESGHQDPKDEMLVRMTIPMIKAYTAKKAVEVVSEGIELIGGQGYMEDTHIPELLRDAQVLPIWEGTTNMACFDVLRTIEKSKGENLKIFLQEVQSRMHQSNLHELVIQRVKTARQNVEDFACWYDVNRDTPTRSYVLTRARDFTFSLTNIWIASLLAQQHQASGNVRDKEICKRFILDTPLVTHSIVDNYDNLKDENKRIALHLDPELNSKRLEMIFYDL